MTEVIAAIAVGTVCCLAMAHCPPSALVIIPFVAWKAITE